MTRMFLLTPAILTIAFATAARADAPKEGPPRPQPPHGQFDPMRMFERLDADKEGAISLEKLPERMPERLKETLTKGDTDKDGKLTKEEFKTVAEAMRKQFAERRREAASGDKAKPTGHPGRPKDSFGKPEGRSQHGDRDTAKGGPPHRPGPGAFRPPMPDPKAIFARMDRDESGELSLEEFTRGMKRMRSHMMRHAHACPPMGQHGWPAMKPSWHRGPDGPPREPGAKLSEAKPCERPDGDRPEARPDRPRRHDGDRPEARPDRPQRSRVEKPRKEKPAKEKPEDAKPTEKPAKEA